MPAWVPLSSDPSGRYSAPWCSLGEIAATKPNADPMLLFRAQAAYVRSLTAATEAMGAVVPHSTLAVLSREYVEYYSCCRGCNSDMRVAMGADPSDHSDESELCCHESCTGQHTWDPARRGPFGNITMACVSCRKCLSCATHVPAPRLVCVEPNPGPGVDELDSAIDAMIRPALDAGKFPIYVVINSGGGGTTAHRLGRLHDPETYDPTGAEAMKVIRHSALPDEVKARTYSMFVADTVSKANPKVVRVHDASAVPQGYSSIPIPVEFEGMNDNQSANLKRLGGRGFTRDVADKVLAKLALSVKERSTGAVPAPRLVGIEPNPGPVKRSLAPAKSSALVDSRKGSTVATRPPPQTPAEIRQRYIAVKIVKEEATFAKAAAKEEAEFAKTANSLASGLSASEIADAIEAEQNAQSNDPAVKEFGATLAALLARLVDPDLPDDEMLAIWSAIVVETPDSELRLPRVGAAFLAAIVSYPCEDEIVGQLLGRICASGNWGAAMYHYYGIKDVPTKPPGERGGKESTTAFKPDTSAKPDKDADREALVARKVRQAAAICSRRGLDNMDCSPNTRAIVRAICGAMRLSGDDRVAVGNKVWPGNDETERLRYSMRLDSIDKGITARIGHAVAMQLVNIRGHKVDQIAINWENVRAKGALEEDALRLNREMHAHNGNGETSAAKLVEMARAGSGPLRDFTPSMLSHFQNSTRPAQQRMVDTASAHFAGAGPAPRVVEAIDPTVYNQAAGVAQLAPMATGTNLSSDVAKMVESAGRAIVNRDASRFAVHGRFGGPDTPYTGPDSRFAGMTWAEVLRTLRPDDPSDVIYAAHDTAYSGARKAEEAGDKELARRIRSESDVTLQNRLAALKPQGLAEEVTKVVGSVPFSILQALGFRDKGQALTPETEARIVELLQPKSQADVDVLRAALDAADRIKSDKEGSNKFPDIAGAIGFGTTVKANGDMGAKLGPIEVPLPGQNDFTVKDIVSGNFEAPLTRFADRILPGAGQALPAISNLLSSGGGTGAAAAAAESANQSQHAANGNIDAAAEMAARSHNSEMHAKNGNTSNGSECTIKDVANGGELPGEDGFSQMEDINSILEAAERYSMAHSRETTLVRSDFSKGEGFEDIASMFAVAQGADTSNGVNAMSLFTKNTLHAVLNYVTLDDSEVLYFDQPSVEIVPSGTLVPIMQTLAISEPMQALLTQANTGALVSTAAALKSDILIAGQYLPTIIQRLLSLEVTSVTGAKSRGYPQIRPMLMGALANAFSAMVGLTSVIPLATAPLGAYRRADAADIGVADSGFPDIRLIDNIEEGFVEADYIVISADQAPGWIPYVQTGTPVEITDTNGDAYNYLVVQVLAMNNTSLAGTNNMVSAAANTIGSGGEIVTLLGMGLGPLIKSSFSITYTDPNVNKEAAELWDTKYHNIQWRYWANHYSYAPPGEAPAQPVRLLVVIATGGYTPGAQVANFGGSVVYTEQVSPNALGQVTLLHTVNNAAADVLFYARTYSHLMMLTAIETLCRQNGWSGQLASAYTRVFGSTSVMATGGLGRTGRSDAGVLQQAGISYTSSQMVTPALGDVWSQGACMWSCGMPTTNRVRPNDGADVYIGSMPPCAQLREAPVMPEHVATLWLHMLGIIVSAPSGTKSLTPLVRSMLPRLLSLEHCMATWISAGYAAAYAKGGIRRYDVYNPAPTMFTAIQEVLGTSDGNVSAGVIYACAYAAKCGAKMFNAVCDFTFINSSPPNRDDVTELVQYIMPDPDNPTTFQGDWPVAGCNLINDRLGWPSYGHSALLSKGGYMSTFTPDLAMYDKKATIVRATAFTQPGIHQTSMYTGDRNEIADQITTWSDAVAAFTALTCIQPDRFSLYFVVNPTASVVRAITNAAGISSTTPLKYATSGQWSLTGEEMTLLMTEVLLGSYRTVPARTTGYADCAIGSFPPRYRGVAVQYYLDIDNLVYASKPVGSVGLIPSWAGTQKFSDVPSILPIGAVPSRPTQALPTWFSAADIKRRLPRVQVDTSGMNDAGKGTVPAGQGAANLVDESLISQSPAAGKSGGGVEG